MSVIINVDQVNGEAFVFWMAQDVHDIWFLYSWQCFLSGKMLEKEIKWKPFGCYFWKDSKAWQAYLKAEQWNKTAF